MSPTKTNGTSTALERARQSTGALWSPEHFFNRFRSEIDRFFSEPHSLFPRMGWMPATDVYEQDGVMVVKAELPGMKKEDIDISIEGEELVIRGERTDEERVEEKNYMRMERSFGSFYRRVPLPKGVDANKITATTNNGVLEVRIPQPAVAAEEPRKKIAVR